MTNNNTKPLERLLATNEISQTELASGIDKSRAFVSRLLSGDVHPSKETIDATLAFLTKRLRKRVTYEMVFGATPVEASK